MGHHLNMVCLKNNLSPIKIFNVHGFEDESDLGNYYEWVRHVDADNLCNKHNKILSFMVGRPSYKIDETFRLAMVEYWESIAKDKPISYGDIQGEYAYRKLMARGLSKQYNNKIDFVPENILFTTGGVAALHASFYAVNTLLPNKKIVTSLPFHSFYTGYNGREDINFLSTFNVMHNGGVLNAKDLENHLSKLRNDEIAAFLFCDPNNPMATTPGAEEWGKITKILKQYPNPIILDEAYAEMVFNKPHESLLEVSPELKERIILLRSAAKGLSAAGERAAIGVSFNKEIMNLMVKYTLNQSIHSPKSHQYAYAQAMVKLTKRKKKSLSSFYMKKVNYIHKFLKEKGILFNNKNYCPNSTFYIVADFSFMKGKTLNNEAIQVFSSRHNEIEADQDIAYHLLFEHGIAIAPMSFFGENPNKCLLRITCSGTKEELDELLIRLDSVIKLNLT